MKPLATIVSAGLSKFGVREGLYGRELFVEAASEAFKRCPNLSPRRDIDGLFVGQMSESYEHQAHIAPMIATGLAYCRLLRIALRRPVLPQE